MENLVKGSIVLHNGVEYFFIRYATEKTCRIADCKEDVDRDYGFFVNTSHLALPAVEVAKVETTQAPANEFENAIVETLVGVTQVLGQFINEYVTPPMPADFAEEVISQIFSNGNSNGKSNDFESSDDSLADGVKAIMQQPTKVVRKETIALRLLHFFNAHAKQYNCDPIVSLQGEKLFIDAYLQGGSVAFLSGLDHYISTDLLLAMQIFAETEFDKEIYLSENKTVFAKGDLVIDKYGNSFEISKIENAYYLMANATDYETVYVPYKAEELRLVCHYETICLQIESTIEFSNFDCQTFEQYQFGTAYQDFWVYKLKSLAGEDKEYIIREIAELDKEFAKFLCEKVLPKIADYKKLYDFLELAI